jgi:hypothetical protein
MELSEAKYFFWERLKLALSDERQPIPGILEANKVYESVYYREVQRGCRDLKYKLVKDASDRFALDYYLKTDDYSTHKRIEADGNLVELENFEGQFGWPVYDDKAETEKEHQRIREHNQMVYAVLKDKGFEK